MPYLGQAKRIAYQSDTFAFAYFSKDDQSVFHCNPARFYKTVIHLFSFLVRLLQVLCRRHPQYRHHQVCPLHQGNVFT